MIVRSWEMRLISGDVTLKYVLRCQNAALEACLSMTLAAQAMGPVRSHMSGVLPVILIASPAVLVMRVGTDRNA